MTTHPAGNDSPDQLLEARRQIVSMSHKLETALQSLRNKATEGRRLKPQITLAERRLQALHIALCCLDDHFDQLEEQRHKDGRSSGGVDVDVADDTGRDGGSAAGCRRGQAQRSAGIQQTNQALCGLNPAGDSARMNQHPAQRMDVPGQ